MPKGYWIGHLEVKNADQHSRYVPASSAAIQKYGGRFLVRAGDYEQAEGSSRPRHIVVEFASYEDALACYRSPEYQAAKALRKTSAEIDLVIVAGQPQG